MTHCFCVETQKQQRTEGDWEAALDRATIQKLSASCLIQRGGTKPPRQNSRFSDGNPAVRRRLGYRGDGLLASLILKKAAFLRSGTRCCGSRRSTPSSQRDTCPGRWRRPCVPGPACCTAPPGHCPPSRGWWCGAGSPRCGTRTPSLQHPGTGGGHTVKDGLMLQERDDDSASRRWLGCVCSSWFCPSPAPGALPPASGCSFSLKLPLVETKKEPTAQMMRPSAFYHQTETQILVLKINII